MSTWQEQPGPLVAHVFRARCRIKLPQDVAPRHDNDGRKDLVCVNGHIYPEVDAHQLDETCAQPALLFRNNGNGTFTKMGAAAGDVWSQRWDACRNGAAGQPSRRCCLRSVRGC